MPKARQEPFPGICRTALLDEVEPLLDALRRKVLWREGLGGWECMALQSIYPLAYLYRTPFRGNAYCGSGETLAAATEVGDFLCACILPERSAGYAATSQMLLATRDWAILFWLDAYALLRPSLPAGRRRRRRQAATMRVPTALNSLPPSTCTATTIATIVPPAIAIPIALPNTAITSARHPRITLTP